MGCGGDYSAHGIKHFAVFLYIYFYIFFILFLFSYFSSYFFFTGKLLLSLYIAKRGKLATKT